MPAKTLLAATFLAMASLAAPAFADGDAPNYGNCAPLGATEAISMTTVVPDTLTVATVLPNPGWWNGLSPADTKDGFEYCLAAEVARSAGLKHLVLKPMAWDQLISGAATGYDIAMATMMATDKRREVFDFTQDFFGSDLGVAVRKGADVTAANLRDKRIGVLQGNLGADWVINTLKPNVQPSQYQGQSEMVTALLAGQVDAVMTDTTLLLTATAATNGALDVVGQFKTGWVLNMALPKNSPNTAAVDSVVGRVKANGGIDTLSATYLAPLFGRDPNTVPQWPLN